MSDELLELGFRPSEADIAPTATPRIDLSLDLQDIHAGMKRKLRKWSRRWPTCGVTVRTGGKADIPPARGSHCQVGRVPELPAAVAGIHRTPLPAEHAK